MNVIIRLIGAWGASCLAAWLVREFAINLIVDGLWIELDQKTAFNVYSTIEFVSRIVQGSVFFLIAGVLTLGNMIDRLNKESEAR